MSQAKVDRYKKEKKNRGKQIKKKRFIKSLWVIVIALFIGAGIGYPLGKGLYKLNAEKRKANETVNSDYYYAWINNYWNANYTGTLGFSVPVSDATDTDAVSSDSTEISTPEDAE